jgi:hypothetical protein
VKSGIAAVTSDPTTASPTADVRPVAVRLIDANNKPLYGKSVTFTSTGVGGFNRCDRQADRQHQHRAGGRRLRRAR